MNFWDTSALIPLILSETSSKDLRQAHDKDRGTVVWWGTFVEGVSALARAERERVVSHDQLVGLLARWEDLIDTCIIVEPSSSILSRAKRLLLSHALSAADALQLGAALIGFQERPENAGFFSADKRLLQAATREGFRTHSVSRKSNVT